MTVILSAIIPVSFIIFLGYIAGRKLPLDRSSLALIAIYILSPALIAGNLYRATLSARSALGLIAGFLLTSLSLYLLVKLIGTTIKLSSESYRSLLASSLFPNAGNLGLPLITFSLGTAGLERAVIYLIISSIFIYSVCPALLQANHWQAGLKLTLKLPLLWSILAGLVLRSLSIQLPWRLDDSIEMLGNAAIPLALIILGIQLANTSLQLGKYELTAACLRLLAAPILAYGIGHLLHLETLDLQVLVLQSATPTAVNTVVLVTQFGGDASRVARTVVVSTLLSFITLPIVLGVSAYF